MNTTTTPAREILRNFSVSVLEAIEDLDVLLEREEGDVLTRLAAFKRYCDLWVAGYRVVEEAGEGTRALEIFCTTTALPENLDGAEIRRLAAATVDLFAVVKVLEISFAPISDLEDR